MHSFTFLSRRSKCRWFGSEFIHFYTHGVGLVGDTLSTPPVTMLDIVSTISLAINPPIKCRPPWLVALTGSPWTPGCSRRRTCPTRSWTPPDSIQSSATPTCLCVAVQESKQQGRWLSLDFLIHFKITNFLFSKD